MAKIERMAADDRRAHLLAVPAAGRFTRWKGRIVLDFSPELRGSDRRLYSFAGRAFASETEAQAVLERIRGHAIHMPLRDAIARFRGSRSRAHRVSDVIDRYLEAAPRLVSERTGRPLRKRTIEAYRRVLDRSKPFWGEMTIAEATNARVLREWRAWFRLPEPEGRGLQSDQEARNAFAALRAVVAWHRMAHPDFPAPDWPSMPSAITAKRENQAERDPQRITLPESVRVIEAIPERRRAIFWVMFYCGARPTEARGVLARDYDRPRLTIRRSAESRHGGAAIDPVTKTAETGTYTLPEWVCDLIDETTREERLIPDGPLFVNHHPQAPAGIYSDDALGDAWKAACDRAGVPYVPLYRATKHTPFSALRLAGVPLDELSDLYRWTGSGTAEHYDERKDERRGGVVRRLDEMVKGARDGTRD